MIPDEKIKRELKELKARRGLLQALMQPPMTAGAFKCAVLSKGWRLKELAEYWGITPVWLSRIVHDENRSRYYDDAVRALPRLGRSRIAAPATRRPKRRQQPAGLRYRGYLIPGAVVAVAQDLGSMAEEGMRGIVVRVIVREDEELYGILFENGEYEELPPDWIDRHIAMTGLEAAGGSEYRFSTREALQRSYEEGQFVFWW